MSIGIQKCIEMHLLEQKYYEDEWGQGDKNNILDSNIANGLFRKSILFLYNKFLVRSLAFSAAQQRYQCWNTTN